MSPTGARLVRDYASPHVVTVRPDLPLAEVRHLLESRDISGVPVVDGAGVLRGLVSMTDLLHGPRGEGEPEAMPVASDVMEPHVVTVDEGATLAQAAELMLSREIHRVVVTRAGALSGILSTRDVARAVLEDRVETPLAEVMTSPALAIDLGETIHTAVERLAAAGVRGLVVTDEERPVGVFTQLEAVKARGLPLEQQQTLPVEEVMSYETICLDVSTPLYRVAGHIVQMRVRRVLAVDQHRLEGVLSDFDLLRTIGA